jgi:Predicted membrane protein
MFVLGGICFVAIGLINKYLSWETPLIAQALIGAVIVTVLEFLTECIVNLGLGWNVCDYSRMPFNLLGQIFLPFFVLWIGLSIVGIILDDYLRYWLFSEDKPRYILI